MFMNFEHPKEISLVFLLSDNIAYGSGTQQVVLNYIRAFKQTKLNVKITVIDTKRLPGNVRIYDKEYINSVMGNITYKSLVSLPRFYYFLGKTRYTKRIFYDVIEPTTLKVFGRIFYRGLINNLSESNFIICIDNNMVFLFPSKIGAKILGTSHALFGGSKQIKLLQNNKISYWKRLDAFISLTNDQEIIDMCDKPLFVLPNGVDVARYYPVKTNNETLKFIFFARLSEEKGVLQLLEIWKKVQNKQNAELHVAGDGPLKSVVMNSHMQNFHYHGRLENDKIINFIQSGDILIYPTFKDVFPLVVLESFSCGMYCILSERLDGVFDDFVGQGFSEYINVSDTNLVARRIDEIIANKENSKLDKDKIYKYVSENYSWATIVDKLYKNLLTLKT